MPTSQLMPLGSMPPVSVLNQRGDQWSRSPARRRRVTARLKTAGPAASLKGETAPRAPTPPRAVGPSPKGSAPRLVGRGPERALREDGREVDAEVPRRVRVADRLLDRIGHLGRGPRDRRVVGRLALERGL